MSQAKVLLVDDDASILNAYERTLEEDFEVHISKNADDALTKMQYTEFATIVSDRYMPGMNGIDLLKKVKEKCPETSRILFTGYGDLNAAMEAVNEGHIFRLLTKPCHPNIFLKAVQDACKQYELLKMEDNLMEKTFVQATNMLFELVTLFHPSVNHYIIEAQNTIKKLATILHIPQVWELNVATMFSKLGYLLMATDKNILSEKESHLFEKQAEISFLLLEKIPSLNSVAKYVRYYHYPLNSHVFENPEPGQEHLPLMCSLIKISLDYSLSMTLKGKNSQEALEDIQSQAEHIYHKEAKKALIQAIGSKKEGFVLQEIHSLSHLKKSMIVKEDMTCDKKGQILLKKGQVLSEVSLLRLNKLATHYELDYPIYVMVKKLL